MIHAVVMRMCVYMKIHFLDLAFTANKAVCFVKSSSHVNKDVSTPKGITNVDAKLLCA